MDEPRCPYCGANMDMDGGSYGWYYVCQKCNAQSPCCKTREEVRAAAMRRPMQEPMTHDALLEKLPFERIAQALEGIEKALQILVHKRPGEQRAEELVWQYGQYVDKTVAAQILGVTRATVYAMLADGRITGAYAGRKIEVQSIAEYMASTKNGSTE